MSAPGESNEKQLGLSVTEKDSEKLTYDLGLMLDVTASMTDEIDAARNTLFKIINDCQEKYKNYVFRIGLVCYRDYKDHVRFVKRDFTEDVNSIVKTLEKVEATGGADEAEDVAGALNEVKQMNWIGDKRQLVIVCDAPCHGRQYHDGVSDYYPDGDKFGLNPEDIITELASNRIGVMAFQMNLKTKIMFKLFDMAYQKGRVPGIKANFILSDMTEQLAQAKEDFRRKRVEDEIRAREEREHRYEEERRLMREAFIAEYGELPEGIDGLYNGSLLNRDDDDNDRSCGFDDDDSVSRSMGPKSMNPLLIKFMEMQQERLARLEMVPAMNELKESPSDGVFSSLMLSAVSSQLD